MPVLIDNRFLHSTAHVYYRSIIVDICTLFDDNRHQSNNFHLLIKKGKKYCQELTPDSIILIEEKLAESEIYLLEEIINIRNEEISHYRFKEGTRISFNLEYLKDLNNLFEIAKQIIKIAEFGFADKSKNSGHRIGTPEHSLDSLQHLLRDISNVDYEMIWTTRK